MEQWHDFYLMLGGASAALVGLLFIGLSLHLHVVVARRELRALVRQAFSNFLNIVVIAAFVLIPQQGLDALGLELFLLGAGNLVILAPRLRIVLAHRDAPAFRDDAGRFGLAVLSYLGLVAVGLAVWSEHSDGLYWLVAVVLFLLLTAARNAWELLVEMGEETAEPTRSGERRG